jgi:hypothetical protein
MIRKKKESFMRRLMSEQKRVVLLNKEQNRPFIEDNTLTW